MPESDGNIQRRLLAPDAKNSTILGSECNPYTDVEENYFRKIYLVTKNKRKINNRK